MAALAAKSAASHPSTYGTLTDTLFSAENVPTVSSMTTKPHPAVASKSTPALSA